MSKITIELVKELRDATSISVIQCKNALEEAGGDMKKALAILKKSSSDIALKKKDRELKDGRVTIKSNEKKSVLVALHCETDFVAKNEDLIVLLENLANKALTEGIDEMNKDAKEMIDSVIQKTGENIGLGESYELEGKIIGNYIHGNKIAIMVSLEGGNIELAKDIAMHIAAMKPEYIQTSDIDEEIKKTMVEIFQKETSKSNKPEEIKKKMLESKISTYFKERTLLDQIFIKNTDKNTKETVGQLLKRNNATIKKIKKYSI